MENAEVQNGEEPTEADDAENNQQQKPKPSGKGKGVDCKRCGHVCKNKRELINHRKEHRVRGAHRSSTIPEKENQPSTAFQPIPENQPSTSYQPLERGSPPTGHSVTCRKCRESFPNRRALYLHQKLLHQSGEGTEVQFPWEERGDQAPWGDDERLRDTFLANKNFILSKGDKGSLKTTVNSPLENNVSTENLIEILQNSCRTESRTFRLNLSFGFILQNVETREYRYFIPDRNETVFDRPVLINNMRDIRKKLREKLNSINLMEYLQRQRPNSKWRIVHITNVKLYFFRTKFLFS
ncbi:uncharacterized protein LOC134241510 [Saccostrea cucullata]|uniref:uncharacterized protein LOC134241510 n=1 Tax=Saccostrea cuccullata TaxID=36930 RepID=UPI002ED678D2